MFIFSSFIFLKVSEFKKILNEKFGENQSAMKEFIKSKYFEFVESIQNINDAKTLIKYTDEVLVQLEDNIQVILKRFNY